MKHVIICGFPRSGTSLLHSLMQNSLMGFNFLEKEVPATSVSDLKSSIVTKRPLDSSGIGKISELLKDRKLYFLFCIRDVRDLICSVHPESPHDYFIDFTDQIGIFPDGSTGPYAPGIRRYYWAHQKYTQLIFTIKYEKLVSEPDYLQDQIFQYIDEPIKNRFSDFSIESKVSPGMISALNGVRAIDTNSVGIWRRHPRRIWDEFTRTPLLFDVLSYFHYEQNREWFAKTFKAKLP